MKSKSGAERVRVGPPAWTTEVFRSRAVDEGDVTLDEGERKLGDGGLWKSLGHRLGGGTRRQKEALPEESEGQREWTEGPATSALYLSGT